MRLQCPTRQDVLRYNEKGGSVTGFALVIEGFLQRNTEAGKGWLAQDQSRSMVKSNALAATDTQRRQTFSRVAFNHFVHQ
ncbi:hypothetical protein LFZ31_15035 [Salmonella enterica subsp. enterica serovar Newport str. S09097]|nr:hypothetical protein LFZ31_15035 [Salmonella enterica subsp. enterica serovar Newport str. S09097]